MARNDGVGIGRAGEAVGVAVRKGADGDGRGDAGAAAFETGAASGRGGGSTRTASSDDAAAKAAIPAETAQRLAMVIRATGSRLRFE
jgi:hypothetical protein